MSKEDRRLQILASAREVFARSGYHAATVEEIVSSAKIARGTFYLYFDDKRAVFADLVDKLFMRLSMAIVRVDVSEGARDVESQVRENIRRILGVLIEDRMMAKIFVVDAMGVDPAFDAKVQGFYAELGRLFTESLADGQALGVVREGNVALMAHFTMGGLKEVLYQLVVRRQDLPMDALVDGIYDLVTRGFLIREAAGAGGRRSSPKA